MGEILIMLKFHVVLLIVLLSQLIETIYYIIKYKREGNSVFYGCTIRNCIGLVLMIIVYIGFFIYWHWFDTPPAPPEWMTMAQYF